MGSVVFEELVLFIKLEMVLCDLWQLLVILFDFGLVYYEVELVVLIGVILCQVMEEYVCKVIVGYGVVFDLILCDVQGKMKKVGQLWEKVKVFDNFCLFFGFIFVVEFIGDL